MHATAAMSTTAPAVIQTPRAATKTARLEDQIRTACRVRHYSLATEKTYQLIRSYPLRLRSGRT